jgi:hypothetical protein
MANDAPKIRITYLEANGHRTVAVTGAHGGLTPTGHVQVSLYHERVGKPPSVTRDQETGVETVEDQSPGVVPVERIVEVSMILRSDIAHAIGQWLVDQSKRVDEQKIEGSSHADSESRNK